MRCPFCGHAESKVIDSRPTDEGEKIRRRRECISCGKRFTTYEIIESVPIMIIKKEFTFTAEKKPRPLHIYLPDNYDYTNERYPVMYFFDGHNLFNDEDATYGKSWGMKEFLKWWSKDMIIVGIECGHGEGERLSEYLPYPAEYGRFSKIPMMLMFDAPL